MAEQPDAAPAEPGGDAPDSVNEKDAKGGGFRMWMILIPAILLPAIGGAALAMNQYDTLSRLAAETRVRFTSDDEGATEKREYGQFLEFGGIIVNPAGSNGKRFLMIDIGLESSSASVLSELERKEIVVRDRMLKVLSSRTVEELASLEGRNLLKDELLDTVNAVLDGGRVDYLYFTQFVLQ